MQPWRGWARRMRAHRCMGAMASLRLPGRASEAENTYLHSTRYYCGS